MNRDEFPDSAGEFAACQDSTRTAMSGTIDHDELEIWAQFF